MKKLVIAKTFCSFIDDVNGDEVVHADDVKTADASVNLNAMLADDEVIQVHENRRVSFHKNGNQLPVPDRLKPLVAKLWGADETNPSKFVTVKIDAATARSNRAKP